MTNASETIVRPIAGRTRVGAHGLAIGISAVALVAAVTAAAAVMDGETAQPTAPTADGEPISRRDLVADWVNRGLVPAQTLQPMRGDLVADWVNRGLVPAQTLRPSRDEIVRDLVNRGLVPRQTLEPATALAGG